MAKSHQKFVDDMRRIALANEKSPPRKHHLVPANYLRRWESDGQLWVTDLLAKKTYKTSAANAIRDTDFYRIDHEDIDPAELPPLFLETMLSKIEGAGMESHNFLLEHGEEMLSNKSRFELSLFIAFQYARGQKFRLAMRKLTHGVMKHKIPDLTTPEEVRFQHGSNLTDAEVKEILGGYELIRKDKITIELSKAAQLGEIGLIAVTLCEFIFKRRWLICSTPSDLVTVDEPVVLLGGPSHPRASQSGFASAEIVLFPLNPRNLLVMFDPFLELASEALLPELNFGETSEVNLELVATAHRWRISSGRNPASLVPLLPPPVPYALVEDPVPVLNKDRSEVIHTFPPSRWLYAPNQPWPVARWWLRAHLRPINGHRDSPWVPSSGVYVSNGEFDLGSQK